MSAQPYTGGTPSKVARDYPGITPKLAVGALLAIQIMIGYEWFLSGLTKVWRGGFSAGFAADLKDKSQAASSWYRTFLFDTIIPNSKTFALLITVGELAVGVVLIGVSVLWLIRWSQLSDRVRLITLVLVGGASLSAVFMAVNFHLASGAHHPWLIPRTGFDESIDLDTVLLVVQFAMVVFTIRELRSIRESRRLARNAPTATRIDLAATEAKRDHAAADARQELAVTEFKKRAATQASRDHAAADAKQEQALADVQKDDAAAEAKKDHAGVA